MTNKKAVIYARVSSVGDRQDTTRQVADLQRFATANDMSIEKVFEEKISGAKEDRPVLSECVDFLTAGKANVLLVSELSRLGRTMRIVVDVIDNLTKAGIDIYLQTPGIHTLNPDGSKNPLTTMLVAMLSSFAEMEREQIRYRLESGRKLAIERGVKMGRKPGVKMSDKELLEKYPQVVRKLRKGLSVREIAGACGVSTTTVQKVKKAIIPLFRPSTH
ncbi:MAG: recombinase family protein [Bacteroidales bacterium]|nr:recombinase family protein [Bacteroidales bacterium]